MHSRTIAATSDHFGALINGNLSEANKRSVRYPEVDPEDFGRFVEYAYYRDYTVPSWTLDETIQAASDTEYRSDASRSAIEEAVVSLQEKTEVVAGWPDAPPPESLWPEEPQPTESWPAPSSKKAKKKGKRVISRNPRARFQERNYLSGVPSELLSKGFEAKSNSELEQNFTPVFLAHARLYTFAEMRLIDPLKDLALSKLHKTLLGFKLYHQRVGDIVELARYAYENGPDRSEDGTSNALRQLVVEYMACEIHAVGKHKAFRSFLEEGGEFVSDFWDVVSWQL